MNSCRRNSHLLSGSLRRLVAAKTLSAVFACVFVGEKQAVCVCVCVCARMRWVFISRETVVQAVLWLAAKDSPAVRSAYTSSELNPRSICPPTLCACACVRRYMSCTYSGEYKPFSPHLKRPTGCKTHTIVLGAQHNEGTYEVLIYAAGLWGYCTLRD